MKPPATLLHLLAFLFLASGFHYVSTPGGPPVSFRQIPLRQEYATDLTLNRNRPAEAPSGFDNQTNGFDLQGPDYDQLDEHSAVPLRSFNDNRFAFERPETPEDGLGPTYNARSCGQCHGNVAAGGSGHVVELRTARRGGPFGTTAGSLIQAQATHAEIMEHVDPADNVHAFRLTTNVLGSGFVECIANETLLSIRDSQPAEMRGMAVLVPVLEGDGGLRVGRFGWKGQHASLESFTAEAYLNEIGITSPLFPVENTAGDRFVGFGSGFDPVPEPEDDGTDVKALTNFMRSTTVPPRGPVTSDVKAGEAIFDDIGCSVCHIATITTAAPGTRINGGAFTVPSALGSRIIHPYSDFLAHDIGTGDGLSARSAAGMEITATMMRTAPLWGLRTRNRLMHDGQSLTLEEAIVRHDGQAAGTRRAYERLSEPRRRWLLAFLESL